MDHNTSDPEQRDTKGDVGYVKGDNARGNVNKNTTNVHGKNANVHVGDTTNTYHGPVTVSPAPGNLPVIAVGLALLFALLVVIVVVTQSLSRVTVLPGSSPGPATAPAHSPGLAARRALVRPR